MGNKVIDMWNDDITFCPNDRCDNMECFRNPKHIRVKDIPHSFYMEIPKECLEEKKGLISK